MIEEEQVVEILDKIRPQLQMDGGDVEFVGIDGNTVQIRLQGHCAGCMHAQMTLKMGIERILRQEIPEIEAVENVA
ncbi:MAG TPA: NifU family protein [Candidatus Lokiarchaeia archaeon]|nr:NifU family protein [Candidatus Lokiarchaeia archaeon]